MFLSMRILNIAKLDRLSPNGSFDPEGFAPVEKIPNTVSSLSAKEIVMAMFDFGSLSPEKLGK